MEEIWCVRGIWEVKGCQLAVVPVQGNYARNLWSYSRDLKSLDAKDRETLEMLNGLVVLLPKNELINTKALVKAQTIGDLKKAWVGTRGFIVLTCCFL